MKKNWWEYLGMSAIGIFTIALFIMKQFPSHITAVIGTSLIILSILSAGVYFFMEQGDS